MSSHIHPSSIDNGIATLLHAAHERDRARRRTMQVMRDTRRLLAVHPDRRRLIERLVTSTGISMTEAQAFRDLEAQTTRAFLAEQKRVAAEQSPTIAARHARFARQQQAAYAPVAGLQVPLAQAFTFVTLDTAAQLDAFIYPDEDVPPNYIVDISFGKPTPLNNSFRAFLQVSGERDAGLYASFDFYALFLWTAPSDVAVNMITFVQPNGTYTAWQYWTPFITDQACVFLGASLNSILLSSSAAATPDLVSQPSDSVSHCVTVGPFDFLGAVDSGTINDQFTLFDNSMTPVMAGETLLVLVAVNGYVESGRQLGEQGNGFVEIDLNNSEGFGVNIPAVYLFTFPLS